MRPGYWPRRVGSPRQCSGPTWRPVPRPTPTARSTWSITPPGWSRRPAVATDPRKLKPGELCRLLNSTPLGEVISEGQLRRQRSRAGLRIGDGKCIDLVRYVAWLVQHRHTPKTETTNAATVDLAEAAIGAAALGSAAEGRGLTSKQEGG